MPSAVPTTLVSSSDVAHFVDATIDFALDLFAYLPTLYENDAGADFFTLAKASSFR